MATSSHPVELSRAQIMAYRILASGLDRSSSGLAELPIWGLGVQDTGGSAALAVAARLPSAQHISLQDGSWLSAPQSGGSNAAGSNAAGSEANGQGEMVLVWSLRGSPHIHRRQDLTTISNAIWPANDADGEARLVGSGATLAKNSTSPLEALTSVAEVMRKVCTRPMSKPELSAAVTDAALDEYSAYCTPCGAVHVLEMLFRSAALPAGLGLVPELKPATLAPLRPTVRTPKKQAGLAALVDAYFEAYATGSAADLAGYFGTGPGHLKEPSGTLPADLQPVSIDGVRSMSTPALIAAVSMTDPDRVTDITRLLPPSDPLLAPRDRATTVADKAAASTLWKAIGSPGAILIGGRIAGTWRPRKTAKKLTITVTEFAALTKADRAAISDEAETIGFVRGVPDVEVRFQR